MAIKIAVCNTERGGLADPERSSLIAQKLLQLDADAVVITEAFNDGDEEQFDTLQVALERLQDAGYEPRLQRNQDTDGRLDRRGTVVLNRIAAKEPYAVDMVTRKAIGWSLQDPETGAFIELAAPHLDDRSPVTRLGQVAALMGWAADWPGPKVIAGDLNQPYYNDPGARLLRAIRPAARMIPREEPGLERSRLTRLGSVLFRLTDTAKSPLMEHFAVAGLIDADPQHQPTLVHGPLKLQIDHILHSQELQATAFGVHDILDGLTDHKTISATLNVQ
ncbi:MAG TPA: endonuclease/exonuclease/phosphatase family protein [Candidatus Saccharimonadales bacterium]|nr:endonuclease/exonuclease/phosphatase family protein [Candidatus Saccharimonadales bacterium]